MIDILKLRLLLSLCGSLLLVACAADPREHADMLAQPVGLQREQVRAGEFLLTAYVRITRSDLPLTVYIEGDGHAWRSRTEPSTDPTPHEAMGLRLAAADRSANVLYLARPCQFTPMLDNPQCTNTYWTDKRFAPEVIASMDAAVSNYQKQLPGRSINLVGYSGGGAVAVLLAARRTDVASLRTVAGNLDHEAVNRWHKVSSMSDSLNPIEVVDKVAAIPQLHIAGADDRIVPVVITRNFVAKAGACARLLVVDGMSHETDWSRLWPELLAARLPCKN